MGKKWYLSKTLWVNILAAGALFIQSQYGYAMPVTYQMGALAVVNFVLRLITHQGIE